MKLQEKFFSLRFLFGWRGLRERLGAKQYAAIAKNPKRAKDKIANLYRYHFTSKFAQSRALYQLKYIINLYDVKSVSSKGKKRKGKLVDVAVRKSELFNLDAIQRVGEDMTRRIENDFQSLVFEIVSITLQKRILPEVGKGGKAKTKRVRDLRYRNERLE